MPTRIFAILIQLMIIGCKTVDTGTDRQSSHSIPIEILLTPSAETLDTDSKPSQFWLHAAISNRSILATGKSTNGLSYISGNAGIHLPVSIAALQCMNQIFQTIDKSRAELSGTWLSFSKQHPNRFLEPMAELHDFYSSGDSLQGSSSKSEMNPWLEPVLWNGFKSTNSSKPGDSGFKVRGYIKWRGALLSDGKTCLISQPDQIIKLLHASMQCEAGESLYCNFRTEDL